MRRLLFLALLVGLVVGVTAEAGCPPIYYCNGVCYNYGCNYSSNDCNLCKELEGGCASWSNCSCCLAFGASF